MIMPETPCASLICENGTFQDCMQCMELVYREEMISRPKNYALSHCDAGRLNGKKNN